MGVHNQFHSVFSPKDTITAKEFELRCPPLPYCPAYSVCDDISIMEEGVKKILLSLEPNKACGPEWITPRLLTMVATSLTLVLYFVEH